MSVCGVCKDNIRAYKYGNKSALSTIEAEYMVEFQINHPEQEGSTRITSDRWNHTGKQITVGL